MRIEDVRQNSGLLLGLGILLVVLGMLAIAFSLLTALAAVVTFGILLMIAGLVQCSEAVWSRRFSGSLIYLLAGTLYFFVGLIMVIQPFQAALTLTLVLGALFAIGGVFRIVFALQTRYTDDWGLRLFGGFVTLFIGLVILNRSPAPEIIGLLVGVDILFSGWSIIMLAVAARHVS
jgi:uncharacterized membrane protein HdeD (DUF308 family)